MRRTHPLILALVTLLGLCCFCAPPALAATPPQPKRVLLIDSYHEGFDWSEELIAGLSETLAQRRDVEFQATFMDTRRHASDDYPRALAELYKIRYANERFDCVVASGQPAFDFIMAHGRELFPGARVLFCGASDLSGLPDGPPNFAAGVTRGQQILPTVQALLRLRPQAKEIYFLTGGCRQGRILLEAARRELRGFRGAKLVLLDHDAMSRQEMLERLRGLSRDSLVIYGQWRREDGDRATADFFDQVLDASPAPVFGLFGMGRAPGLVGGMFEDGRALGRQVGGLALTLLAGKAPAGAPLIASTANRFSFDHRQLARWGIDPDDLPPGSRLVNAPESFISRYRSLILGVAGFMVMQTMLIVLLVAAYAKRRKTERALAKSEQDLAITLNSIGEAVIAADVNGVVTRLNPVAQRLTGVPAHKAVGAKLDDVCKLQDGQSGERLTDAARQIIAGGLDIFGEHLILRSADGSRRPVAVSGSGLRDGDKKIVGVVMVLRDVSREREAALALRRSEARYRSLYDSMHEGVALHQLVSDPGGRPYDFVVLDVNPAFERIMNLRRGQVVGMWGSQAMGRHAKTYFERFAQVARSGQPVSFDVDFKELGRSFNVSVFSPGEDLFATILQDITEAKNARDALARSEEKFQKAFYSHPDSIVISNPHDGVMLEVNNSMLSMLGYQPEEILGVSALRIDLWADPADRARFLATIRAEGRCLAMESALRCKGGRIIPVELSGAMLYLGGQERLLTIARDVSERAAAAEALLKSEERFQAAFMASPNSIAITRINDGVVIDVNHAFCRLLGYDRADILADRRLLLAAWQNHADRLTLLAAVKEQDEIAEFETAMRAKSGEIKNIIISARCIDIDGQSCAISVLRDVTQMKLAQQERQRLEEQLRQSQKMEALGTLAGGIAHEFNNLLAAIMGYSELAMARMTTGHACEDEVTQVLAAAERAKGLVRQILTFSRESDYELRPLRALPVVLEALALLRASLPITVDLRQNLASEAVIMADSTALHQVVMNLCTNAAHALPKDGGFIEVSLADEPDPAGGPGWLRLSVADDGAGVDPLIRGRIFEPFFTTKAPGEGTGLGLSVVHGIVSRLGGQINVTDRPGGGSVFGVRLPAVDAESLQDDSAQPANLRGPERIMLVDDEPGLAQTMGELLGCLGYRVAVFQDSRQALYAFQNDPSAFDLLITDQTMPGLTGEALIRRMLALRPDLPVILCTGYSESLKPDDAARLGVRLFLYKPFSHRELAAAVRQVLDHPAVGQGDQACILPSAHAGP
ncbi:multi-sensor hybrid histidine kinase [Desulfarculus baarsii DSM 2075]|uniref:histidine kinase n=1 Tax=Desulfarculus baarsii (strain ATCC 33931 / DSM 2075 / LMG 7858 / VKM B-1802 / 2st14) TaxID=644282 RepID=E1QDY1_DESB2|nr:PAS domain S-box protein [Desulfarculus baarsii]ADK83767.1 multi-sensor hybrid histidine kinase [Desulfarculus baarsii DSM 2075]